MTKEKFYTLLGDLSEETVHAAEHPPVTRRGAGWLRLAAAACVCVIAGAGIRFLSGREQPELPPADSSTAETAVESMDFSIYYVDGGQIVSKTVFLQGTMQAVFACWREANGIGEEVQLLRSEVKSNGTEYSDDSVAGYQVGDSFTICITVTQNLSDYCTGDQGDLLLESLKQTMIGDSWLTYSDYILTLE